MFGGWTDAALSRLTEVIMGFPVLLFLVTLGFTVSDRLQQVTLHGLVPDGVVSLVVILGVFYCFYPLRLVRSQVLQLREQEFVEAARSVGASELRIVRQHLLPFIWGSLLIYATQLLAITIFLEAAFSILNVGISLPTASWGNLIAANYGSALNGPTLAGRRDRHPHDVPARLLAVAAAVPDGTERRRCSPRAFGTPSTRTHRGRSGSLRDPPDPHRARPALRDEHPHVRASSG